MTHLILNMILQKKIYSKKRKYRFNNVPDLFMSSDIWIEGMAQLIELFVNCRKQQDDIDMKHFVIHLPVKWTNILNILIQVKRSKKCTKIINLIGVKN